MEIHISIESSQRIEKQICCTAMLKNIRILKLFIIYAKIDSTTTCDLQLWLNYRDTESYNRVVIKKCEKSDDDNDSSYTCQGCKRTMITNVLNKVSWTLVANFESKMLNFQNETYLIDMKTNGNETFSFYKQPKLRPFWQKISFPSIKFTFVPKPRSLSSSATCFNDPHCRTFDNM
jgi:hypothetical protein